MSERGSFVTEYIYCSKCVEAAEAVLGGDDKHLTGFRIPVWRGIAPAEDLPIIAGKIGGFGSGDELEVFRNQLMPELAKRLCHPLRVAVLAEEGEEIFHIYP